MPKIVLPLSDAAIRKSAPGDKPKRMSDGKGLFLLIETNGTRSWRFTYEYLGKRNTMSFGSYPEVPLAEARRRRDAARDLLASGSDPVTDRRQKRSEAVAQVKNTFGGLVGDMLSELEEDGDLAAVTIKKKRRLLTDHARKLTKRPLDEIKPHEVFTVCKEIERRGHRETAHALRAAIGETFRYGIKNLRTDRDPTEVLRRSLKPVRVVSRPAIVKPDPLAGLLRCIWEYDGWPTLRACLQVQAYCFQRPGETRTMEWDELDLDRGKWTIPEGKMKMRRVHDVPLPRQAVTVLRQMRFITGKSRFVFPSMRNFFRPLSENAMNSALRRMGFRSDEHCAHGFRATAVTLLVELGKEEDVIWPMLAHAQESETKRAYNRSYRWSDRVKTAQFWADYLDSLRAEGPTKKGVRYDNPWMELL